VDFVPTNRDIANHDNVPDTICCRKPSLEAALEKLSSAAIGRRRMRDVRRPVKVRLQLRRPNFSISFPGGIGIPGRDPGLRAKPFLPSRQ
jgi:hypothetical protein